MNETPILVPVKGESYRCPNKNIILLPHTLNYLKKEGRKNVWVISDSKILLEIAKDYSFNCFLETRERQQDELTSCWPLIDRLSFDKFVLCPVTHPFKAKGLISEMETFLNTHIDVLDFVTTSNSLSDRKQFYIKAKGPIEFEFKTMFKNRKGSLSNCSEMIIDGSIYVIKKNFLKKVVRTVDTNSSFWKGRFSCIRNNAPFLDIDSLDDLEKFEFIYDLIYR